MGLELETDDFFAEISEEVVFRTDAGVAVKATAIVTLDRPLRDDSGFTPTIYTGILLLKFADYSRVKTLLTVEQGGYTWRIVDVGVPKSGVFEVAIQRESSQHSNAVDLQGTQHRYGN